MPIRRVVVGRHEDGRKLVVTFGDEMPWKFDYAEEVFHVTSPDGKAKYAVGRLHPTELDRGQKPYRYWRAIVSMDGEVTQLGETYMIAQEGKEVCQIYESARHETKPIEAKKKCLLPRVSGKLGFENS